MSNSEAAVKSLIEQREAAENHIKGWKAEVDRIDGELAKIVGPEEILKAAGKLEDGGSKTVEMHGGKFAVEAKKSVKWDSDILQTLAGTLPWQQVVRLFKIKFEMKEATYKELKGSTEAGMIDAALLKGVDEARTVTVGEAKIKSAELISNQ